MTTIQYASDLHLDYIPNIKDFDEYLTPSADVLVLAGDIASAWNEVYSNFLCWCSWNWKHTILITGNHEYFCNKNEKYSRKETDYHVRVICNTFGNIHFLQRGETYKIPNTDIVFVGTTLYSDIDTEIFEDIRNKGDYTKTFVGKTLRRTTPQDLIKYHKCHRQAISDGIRTTPPNSKVIVVTHYLPTKTMLEEEYHNDRLQSCYYSNMDEAIRKPILLWICGHSHRSVTYLVNDILVTMNARGSKQNEITRTEDAYNKSAIVRV